MLPSTIGALCSIMLIIILLGYTAYKVSILEGKKRVDVIQAVQENYFDDEYVFSGEQGLNIAAGVYNPLNRA